MKKAKLMLTVLTVLAIVGGALAFKAAKFNNNVLFCENAAGQCTVAFPLSKTVVFGLPKSPCVGSPITRTTHYSTTHSLAPCPSVTTAFYTTIAD